MTDHKTTAIKWWICTDLLARGGDKILGPFESRDLALEVRRYFEDHDDALGRTYWVDHEGNGSTGGPA